MAAALTEQTTQYVSKQWDESVIPLMSEYIKIPNVSPVFDPEWLTNGLIEKAAHLLEDWAKARDIAGLNVEYIQSEGKTPLIFISIASNYEGASGTVLMYGHLDKQPPLASWAEGLGPYEPVLRDGKLYGRGGADDGYSICAALISIEALQRQGLQHGRIEIVIEASEESGSPHLPEYVDLLVQQGKLVAPDLIVCLDSGCGTYDQFWVTTSLRGLVAGNLVIKILNEESHSGRASGIVPSSFRIARMLLERLEDTQTGVIKPKELYVDVPATRLLQIKSCGTALGSGVSSEFEFVKGATPVTDNVEELILNRTWRPTLCVTGVDGIPSLSNAGNVLRASTSLKLSIRIPPNLDAKKCAEFIKALLEKDPPYGAHVSFVYDKAGTGWEAPPMAPWLESAMQGASNYFCQKPASYLGEGGSIPFMGMLGQKFPAAQFVVTGLLGPNSNAHGPNEMLHIQMGKHVTSCVASIVHAHFLQFKK